MKSLMTFRDGLNLAMIKEMEMNPAVFVFGLDVPDHKRIFGSTQGLVEKFGKERCFETPLSEDAMTGVALGAAISGLRPIHVHIRADFTMLIMNQVVNMISTTRYISGGKLKVPLVIRAVIGRGWGQAPQHSKSLHSFFAHIPGLKVMMPATPQDAYSLLRASIRDDNPVIFLEHRWLYDIEGEINQKEEGVLGKANIYREGRDLTIVATSWMVVEAIKAAEVLAKRGIALEVIDVRSIYPLDEEAIIHSVQKTKHCIVADYDWSFCGFSAELAALVHHACFKSLKKPVERLGFEHCPCPATRPLENLFYPNAIRIIRTAEKLLDCEPADLSGEVFYDYENKFKGPF